MNLTAALLLVLLVVVGISFHGLLNELGRIRKTLDPWLPILDDLRRQPRDHED